jgi:predicted Ser/Thr protein kinase
VDEPRFVGQYEIVRLLGRGGMGEVYLATDTRMYRRPVALKLLADSMLADGRAAVRFALEVETAAKLQHPNIVTIYDHGTHEGRPYFAMEYLEGEDLASLIKKPGSRTIEGRVEIVVQLCDALDYAHRNGVVHRDIKPANVVVIRRGRDDHIKLLDFGIAKVARPDHTKTLVQPGTMLYMSPEQLKDESVDFRSDLFSLGIVAYELLAGTHPFAARTEYLVTSNIMFGKHPPLRSVDPSIPEELERILDPLLDKDPERRPGSAGQIATELRQGLASLRAAPGGTDPPTFGNIDEMTSAMIERLVHWARTREAAGAPLEALEAYRRAASLAPGAPWLQERVARLEAHALPAEPAAASPESQEGKRETWVVARLQEAESALDEGTLDEASSIVAAILRQFPDERRALDLMDRLVAISDRGIPVREYRQEIRRAREALVVGDVLSARRSCEAAIALWPDDAEASTLGKEIEKRRRVELASTLHAVEEVAGRAEQGAFADEEVEAHLDEGREALERAIVLGADSADIDRWRTLFDRLATAAKARIENAFSAAQRAVEDIERAPAQERVPEARQAIEQARRKAPSDPRADGLSSRLDALVRRLAERAAEIEAITSGLAEIESLLRGPAEGLDRAAELLRSLGRKTIESAEVGAKIEALAQSLARRRGEIDATRRRDEEAHRRRDQAARLLDGARASVDQAERGSTGDLAALRESVASIERAREAIAQASELDSALLGASELANRATALGKLLAERIAEEGKRLEEEARRERVRQTIGQARSAWEQVRSEEQHLDVVADEVLPTLDRAISNLDEALRLSPEDTDAKSLRKDVVALRDRARALAPHAPGRRDANEARTEIAKLRKLEASGRWREALSAATKLERRVGDNPEARDLEADLKALLRALKGRQEDARKRLRRRALWGTTGTLSVAAVVALGLWLRPGPQKREDPLPTPPPIASPPPVDVEPEPTPLPTAPPGVSQAPRAEIAALEGAVRRSALAPRARLGDVRRSVDAAEQGLKRADQLALSYPDDPSIPPLREALQKSYDTATSRRSAMETEVAAGLRQVAQLLADAKASTGPTAHQKHREAVARWEAVHAVDPDNPDLRPLRRELDRLERPVPTDRPALPTPPPTAAPQASPPPPSSQLDAFRQKLDEALAHGRMDLGSVEARIAALRGTQRILDDARRRNEPWAVEHQRSVELQREIDDSEIRLVLFRYARAASALDVEGIRRVWPEYPGGDSLRKLRSYSVQFSSLEVNVGAKRVVASERIELRGSAGAPQRRTATAKYNLEVRDDRWIIVDRSE